MGRFYQRSLEGREVHVYRSLEGREVHVYRSLEGREVHVYRSLEGREVYMYRGLACVLKRFGMYTHSLFINAHPTF